MPSSDDRARVRQRRPDHNRLRYGYYVMTEHARGDRRLSTEAAAIGLLYAVCEPSGPRLGDAPRGSAAGPRHYGTSR
jgi:hypothetical protein